MILKDVCFNDCEKSIPLYPPELKLLLCPSCHILPLHFLFACDLPFFFVGGLAASQLQEGCSGPPVIKEKVPRDPLVMGEEASGAP